MMLVQRRNGVKFGERFNDVTAFRRAVSLWLDSRHVTMRDVVSVMLPRHEGPCLADFILFANGQTHIVALLTATEPLGPQRERFQHLLSVLNHDYRVLRAETPSHAIEQVAKLVDGEDPAI